VGGINLRALSYYQPQQGHDEDTEHAPSYYPAQGRAEPAERSALSYYPPHGRAEPTNNEILPAELTGSLRRGKWTVEEEHYTSRIIHDFENGTLDVPEGTTLRNYLSKTLNCDPMRITKVGARPLALGALFALSPWLTLPMPFIPRNSPGTVA
jgi:hypothetical protein